MRLSILPCAAFALFSFTSWSAAEPGNFAAAKSVLGHADFFGDADFMNPVPPTATEFNFCEGVAVDPVSGKVFVADSENHRILRFSSSAAYQTHAAAEAVFGQSNFTSNDPNQGGAPSATTLSYPLMLAFDAEGRLYATDYSNFRVVRYDDAANKLSGAPADEVIGQADLDTTVQGEAVDSMEELKFRAPTGITVDADGNLWVTDTGLERVVRYDDAATRSGLATPDCVLGQPDLETFDIDTAAQDKFVEPYGISVGPNGELWVADAPAQRILRFDNAASLASGALANGVFGQDNFTDTTLAPASASTFQNPFYVTCAPNGTLWVSDYTNTRVLGFRGAAGESGFVEANVVLGQANPTDATHRPSDQRSLRGPAQVAIGLDGSLFVAVYDQSRVMRFSSDEPTTPPLSVTPAKKKITVKGSKATIRGSSTGALTVKYRVKGQGGFRNTRGPAESWNAKVKKLSSRKSKVQLKAIAASGAVANGKVKIVRKSGN